MSASVSSIGSNIHGVVQFTADPDEAKYRLGLVATTLGANLNILVSSPVAFLNNSEANLFGEAKDGRGR